MSPKSLVRVAPRSWLLAVVSSALSCGLPSKQDVDMAQTVYDLGVAVQDLQQNQLDLLDRVDSLSALVARQDSTMRSLANLLGSPLPR